MLIAASRKSADLFAKFRADKPEGKVKATTCGAKPSSSSTSSSASNGSGASD